MNLFDLIVIGGGATGSGIALDAALRGLKVLLLEQNDFAEGTSSRSTKLAHGGVRYLEAAVKHLDKEQFDLVREGVKERYRLLHNAPHLSRKISLITPLYNWFEVPYIFAGLTLYDLIAGKYSLGRSKIVSKKEIISSNPSVKKEGLKAGVKYFDGAFNDARMVIALLQSAKKEGAIVKNYHKVEAFIFDKNHKIIGVKAYDKISKKEEKFFAKVVVNATGVFSDHIRKLADKNVKNIIKPSSGIHIVIDKKYLPSKNGLMIPKTEDNRVLFILPYMGKCLVGTTDHEAEVTEHPKVKESDIEYLLHHINSYFDLKITKKDILSSFCGLRPLIDQGLGSSNTSKLAREHIIEELDSGLITIAGGKWTTYRNMAEGLVDFIMKKECFRDLDTRCKTYEYKVVGSQGDLDSVKEKLDTILKDKELSERLFLLYGDQALKVLEYEEELDKLRFLDEKYKILLSEVVYCIKEEFVKKPMDFIERRVLLSLVDKKESEKLVEKVEQVIIKETNICNI